MLAVKCYLSNRHFSSYASNIDRFSKETWKLETKRQANRDLNRFCFCFKVINFIIGISTYSTKKNKKISPFSKKTERIKSRGCGKFINEEGGAGKIKSNLHLKIFFHLSL